MVFDKHIRRACTYIIQMGGICMSDITLIGAKVLNDCRNIPGLQEYMEMQLQDGRIVLVTATPSSKLKIGLKIDEQKGINRDSACLDI